MIRWSDIQAEYEGIDLGYRERVVALFRQYEGQETDEVVRGKPVTVTVNSFAKRMGIRQQTLAKWVTQFGLPSTSTPTAPEEVPQSCINKDVPPAEGFVREVNRRLAECVPLLRHLSDETQRMIAEDIAETRRILDEIESNLKVRSK